MYSAESFAKKLGPLVPVRGVAHQGDVWQVHVNDLRPMAVTYRADAVKALDADEGEKAEKLENVADRLYETAELHGVSYVRVPRLSETGAAKSKVSLSCEQCSKTFEAERSSAKYCSQSCRQRASYLRAAA